MEVNPYEAPIASDRPQPNRLSALLRCIFVGSSLVLLLDFVAAIIVSLITPAMLPNPYETHMKAVFVVGAIGLMAWVTSVIVMIARL